mmetsp:Transcript_7224/g.11979  ORF Transcript_7224/g.11979 Transcript_7224/m.11979 type:complete len:371 (+) Transcript_7224:1046-2158(+)
MAVARGVECRRLCQDPSMGEGAACTAPFLVHRAELTPAAVGALGDRDAFDAVHGLVGDQGHTSVKERLAGGVFRLRAVLGPGGNRLDAQRGHQQRILLAGGTDHTVGHVLHAGATAIDGHDQHVVLTANGFQRLIGTGSGRFVDGVDHVDKGVFGQQVFHGAAAALFVTGGDVMADDARIILVAPFVGVFDVDAKAGHEALVAQYADGGLADGEVEHTDFCVGSRVAQLACGPFADQLTCQKVISGKCGVGRVNRLKGRVEGDDQQACVTRLLHRRGDGRGVRGGQQDALGAVRDAGLDGLNLRFMVTIDLTRIGFQCDTKLFGFGGGAFLHLDKEGVGVGFRDQAGRDRMAIRECGARNRRQSKGRAQK